MWSDILRAGKDDSISAHFVGSIVYIEQGIYQVFAIARSGQQRLTTIMLSWRFGFFRKETAQLLSAESR